MRLQFPGRSGREGVAKGAILGGGVLFTVVLRWVCSGGGAACGSGKPFMRPLIRWFLAGMCGTLFSVCGTLYVSRLILCGYCGGTVSRKVGR